MMENQRYGGSCEKCSGVARVEELKDIMADNHFERMQSHLGGWQFARWSSRLTAIKHFAKHVLDSCICGRKYMGCDNILTEYRSNNNHWNHFGRYVRDAYELKNNGYYLNINNDNFEYVRTSMVHTDRCHGNHEGFSTYYNRISGRLVGVNKKGDITTYYRKRSDTPSVKQYQTKKNWEMCLNNVKNNTHIWKPKEHTHSLGIYLSAYDLDVLG
ncbi:MULTISPECIES: hypothetical protein [Cysteiniphilum]|uniref:Uncharacterized protein n=1 Tax=Cysteiniphilum litorale TaxID=2056700 RepID=A0A8J3E8G2_9GAMM|nr:MULTISPECIES: hypothetical protein [Cysteiniphilum]GGF90885.1 hypothetical protein GCM10010995_05210 [Cysteiniphilum litorale]